VPVGEMTSFNVPDLLFDKYIPNTFEELKILKKPVLGVVALEKWNKYLPST
jgi:hypothetical protein